ncbi:TIR domain-containing protein [Mycolicibacterium septicum DSM 44393]|uniref:TIR domain-containing protein n=1 Tax=Mycolicibacterium septicum DSM 44393 TaxID=1341646 RepID=A0A7X6MTY3_9MYCO|nr:TIR domain-containing protein [Mycolicibacterium septicum]NKZ13047.1 TIR domain-containing protein [Mycolicibacterium septicum DSM 44393]
MAPRAFISFEMEDRWARDFLVQHAKDRRNDIEFVDYSVQNPWDSSWKTQCKERIARTKGTIVLVGPTTYASEAVLWEIQETIRQGHYIFGVQINADKTHVIPQGLSAQNVIRWNFDQIVKWLATWT